jgi:hypothetical protein
VTSPLPAVPVEPAPPPLPALPLAPAAPLVPAPPVVPLLPAVPPLPAPDWQAAARTAAVTNAERVLETLAIMPPTAHVTRFCSEKRVLAPALALVAMSCTETRDLGSSASHGRLPVDERNPVLLANDGADDNWQGEYAVLLANSGGPKLAGIVVNTSAPWPDIDANIDGWRRMVAAARASGLEGIPDPTASIGPTLVRPASGRIDDTAPNRSEGARLIVDASVRLSLPYRPLVVATGGRLTDVADAYLIDPTVADRVVVVSSLGATTASGAAMAAPNGEMDPWADAIVTARFRFVQVSAFYDQLTDVPASRLSELPANPFGAWIAAKQPKIWSLPEAADQVAVVAVAIPSFATEVKRVSAAALLGAGATAGPDLVADPNGAAWLVTQSAGAEATARFWKALLGPTLAP